MNFKMKTLVLLLLCVSMATVVCAEEGETHIDGDLTMTFYSDSSEVGQSGYKLSLDDGTNTYYLSTENYDKIEANINNGTDNDTGTSFPTTDEINDALSEDGVDVYNYQVNDADIDIKYETGQTVGSDSDANVITQWIRSDGTAILSDSSE